MIQSVSQCAEKTNSLCVSHLKLIWHRSQMLLHKSVRVKPKNNTGSGGPMIYSNPASRAKQDWGRQPEQGVSEVMPMRQSRRRKKIPPPEAVTIWRAVMMQQNQTVQRWRINSFTQRNFQLLSQGSRDLQNEWVRRQCVVWWDGPRAPSHLDTRF